MFSSQVYKSEGETKENGAQRVDEYLMINKTVVQEKAVPHRYAEVDSNLGRGSELRDQIVSPIDNQKV